MLFCQPNSFRKYHKTFSCNFLGVSQHYDPTIPPSVENMQWLFECSETWPEPLAHTHAHISFRQNAVNASKPRLKPLTSSRRHGMFYRSCASPNAKYLSCDGHTRHSSWFPPSTADTGTLSGTPVMWSRRRESSPAAISRLEIPSPAVRRITNDGDKIRFAIR